MLAYLGNSLIRFLKWWFGDFTKEEIKKFLSLGTIFAFVIGFYWTLRPLKDSIFQSMAHASLQPLAKIVSLFVLIPVLMLYNKLLEKTSTRKALYILCMVYFVATIAFGLAFMHPTIGLANTVASPYRLIAWAWYVFVESFGSIMVALFWAIITNITPPESASRGFSLVYLMGQVGSILGPLLLTKGAVKYFGSSAPVVIVTAFLLLPVIIGFYIFFKVTPKSQLAGFHGKNEQEVEEQQEPGLLEGLKLMISKPYLLGIFVAVSMFEIITTILDFRFKYMVYSECADEAARAFYLGDYAVWLNLISLIMLILGASNVQRKIGLTAALVITPIALGTLVFLMYLYPNLAVLFWLMVAAKAVNYAFNGPSIKQLYVPTSKDVKEKATAWIETFGSRGAKASSSLYNLLNQSFIKWFGKAAGQSYHIAIGSFMALGFSAVWVFIAIYLGKTYKKAVDQKKIVC